jgi:hypothetical protein
LQEKDRPIPPCGYFGDDIKPNHSIDIDVAIPWARSVDEIEGKQMFKLEINTDNAAFEPTWVGEVARLLRETADRIEGSPSPDIGHLRDTNGNSIGGWRFSDE